MTEPQPPETQPSETKPPETKPSEFKRSAKFDGYVMLLLGALLIWIGGYFDNTPNWAHHKLLVSKSDADGTVFEKTVILMLQHRKDGSFGLVVNKPGKDGEFSGGPMEQQKIYALHSTDVIFPASMVMKDVDTGVLEGDAAVKQLTEAKEKPKWHRIIRGYSGWGKRQLNRELERGSWSVTNYSDTIVRDAKPEKMWEEAVKQPALQLSN